MVVTSDLPPHYRDDHSYPFEVARVAGLSDFNSLRAPLSVLVPFHQLLKRLRPDVIHVQSVFPGIALTLIADTLPGTSGDRVHRPQHAHAAPAPLDFRGELLRGRTRVRAVHVQARDVGRRTHSEPALLRLGAETGRASGEAPPDPPRRRREPLLARRRPARDPAGALSRRGEDAAARPGPGGAPQGHHGNPGCAFQPSPRVRGRPPGHHDHPEHLRAEVLRGVAQPDRGFGAEGPGDVPNVLSGLGLAVAVAAAVGFALGAFRWAAVGIAVSGIFDLLDGATARARNPRGSKLGGFVDSAMDRVADSVLLPGIFLHYHLSHPVGHAAPGRQARGSPGSGGLLARSHREVVP